MHAHTNIITALSAQITREAIYKSDLYCGKVSVAKINSERSHSHLYINCICISKIIFYKISIFNHLRVRNNRICVRQLIGIRLEKCAIKQQRNSCSRIEIKKKHF